METGKWFNEYGLMLLEPREPLEAARVNGVLYSCEYLISRLEQGMWSPQDHLIKERLFENLDKTLTNPSHDNLTGLIALSRILGEPLPTKLPYHRYWHPRDILYRVFGSPLLLFPFHFITAISKHKYRPSFIHYLFKLEHGRKMIKTDGLKLYFLRRHQMQGSIFAFVNQITDMIIRWRFGTDYRYQIYKIFFKREDHPLRTMWARKHW